MTSAQLVLFERQGNIATLTLNRPEKRNALTLELWAQLNAHLDTIEVAGRGIQVVVLRANGPSFCAGNDLNQLGDPPVPNFQAKTVTRIAELPMPVVVAVQGGCYTGGLELALAGDIIIASEGTRFADTHGKFSLVPIWGMTQRLPRRVGTYKAREISFTGIPVTGAEAVRIGLANICVADDALEAKIAEIAGAISAQSAHSVFAYKKLYQAQQDLPLQAGLAHEVYTTAGRGADAQDRAGGFTKK